MNDELKKIREGPIIFSAPMVRAILEGRKTQTRRVLLKQPPDGAKVWYRTDNKQYVVTRCSPWFHFKPRYSVGDRLWVRETWASICQNEDHPCVSCRTITEYKADSGNLYPGNWSEEMKDDPACARWKPSIHMPRWASRITLEITRVRIDKIQEISEEDARAEGCDFDDGEPPDGYRDEDRPTARLEFRYVWDSLNTNRGYSWKANPWVWVIEFKKLEALA